MKEKDLGGKTLEGIDEVFSDIFNCVAFNGEKVMKEDELSDSNVYSQYHADGKYHEQYRDIAKYWNKCGVRLAFVGIENESQIDRYMPLRIISYDGGAYRAQLPKHSKKGKKKKQAALYPAVSIVLYFGTERPWRKPLALSEVLTVPEKLKHLVNDYKINVVNVAFLEREQIDKFKSDFWFVADYFWQLRNSKEYRPGKKEIKYAHQVLQMMSALTGDKRFEEAYNKVKKNGGGGSMCEYLDKIVGEGMRKGKREERENGIKVLVESLSEVGIPGAVIAEKVIKKYDLTKEEAERYVDKYSKIPA